MAGHEWLQAAGDKMTTQFEFDPDPEFDAYVASLDKKHWARYDLSAVRLGWEAYKERHENRPWNKKETV